MLDFGIARLRERRPAGRMRTPGAMLGTPAFMAPEQARRAWDEVDGRTDLWAVGATLFTLLTGGLVHVGRSPNELLYMAMTKVARPLAEVLPGVTPAVAHIVDRALEFQRDSRWADAAQMQEAVRRAYHECLGKPIRLRPRSSSPRPCRTGRSATARPPARWRSPPPRGPSRPRRSTRRERGALSCGRSRGWRGRASRWGWWRR